MSPRKLTDTNRNEILDLYRDTGETTSTLAERYGVSSSTISRFLKSRLSESEYEELIQQKRLSRTPGRDTDSPKTNEEEKPSQLDNDVPETNDEEEKPLQVEKLKLKPKQEPILAEENTSEEKTTSSPRRRRRRSSVEEEQPTPQTQLKLPVFTEDEDEEDEDEDEDNNDDLAVLEEMLGEDISDDDDDDWDEDDEDDEDSADDKAVYQLRPRSTEVSIFPISEAALPKTCYVVIDRAAELITRPLKEFRDLGQIPKEEVQQRTLPVFDNHRVARRFSNRSQRVIKVPDGAMLQKTSSYLQAKGINLLLIDGQVYKV
ncbi:MAG: helix-turn-helix domain-containing protein [Spirulinaceae cyanobacterium]